MEKVQRIYGSGFEGYLIPDNLRFILFPPEKVLHCNHYNLMTIKSSGEYVKVMILVRNN